MALPGSSFLHRVALVVQTLVSVLLKSPWAEVAPAFYTAIVVNQDALRASPRLGPRKKIDHYRNVAVSKDLRRHRAIHGVFPVKLGAKAIASKLSDVVALSA